MRLFVALMVLCALSFETALGADVAFPAAEPARAPIIYDPNGPYTNWAGAYLGVNGGYGFGSQWTIGLLGTSVFDTDGFLFGGAADPISAVMLGVEADVDWSGLSGSAANCAVNTSGAVAARQTKSSLLKAARAWAGYALDRTLIYVIGGGRPRSAWRQASTCLSTSPRTPAPAWPIAGPPPTRRSCSPRAW